MRKVTHFLLALALCSLIACRLKAPTVAEQQKLQEMGAFPSGPPPWVSTGARGATVGSWGLGGVGGGSYGSPTGGGGGISRTLNKQESLQEIQQKRAVQTAKVETPEQNSPLGRIEAICPNVERDVTAALTTEETEIRAAKYLALTIRCPNSWDLWLWLGKDYLKLNRNAEAGRAFEKVLSLNNGNAEATDLLLEVRKHQNLSVTPKSDTPSDTPTEVQ